MMNYYRNIFACICIFVTVCNAFPSFGEEFPQIAELSEIDAFPVLPSFHDLDANNIIYLLQGMKRVKSSDANTIDSFLQELKKVKNHINSMIHMLTKKAYFLRVKTLKHYIPAHSKQQIKIDFNCLKEIEKELNDTGVDKKPIKYLFSLINLNSESNDNLTPIFVKTKIAEICKNKYNICWSIKTDDIPIEYKC